jgi:sigma-B regulation protein RsbU (phosphoserine phosphatase)
MATAPSHTVTCSQPETPLHLVCSEEWGGNRMINVPIELPGIRGHLYSIPCGGGQGGDVHYLAVCGAGLLSRLWVSDVVGHGEAVARISNEIHDLLHRYMNQPDQRRVLSGLNRRLGEIGFGAMTTVATATYYAATGKLSISYAGHPPAWYYDSQREKWSELLLPTANKRPRVLTNAPLAIDEQAEFTRIDRATRPGDRILMSTDGVMEAPDPDGNLFGTEPIEKLLNELRKADCSTVGRAIMERVRAYTQRDEMVHDDVTVLVTEFVPGPRGPAMWHAVKNMVLRPRGNSTSPQFIERPSRPNTSCGCQD